MQYSGMAGTKQSLSLAREQELLEHHSRTAGGLMDGGAGDTWDSCSGTP